MRAARTSSLPSPSTRTADTSGACVIATLEMTAADLPGLVGSRVCAGADIVVSVKLASITQPYLTAGQFVFIAVLLNWWSRFACSLGVPPACQKRLFLLRGTKRRPW